MNGADGGFPIINLGNCPSIFWYFVGETKKGEKRVFAIQVVVKKPSFLAEGELESIFKSIKGNTEAINNAVWHSPTFNWLFNNEEELAKSHYSREGKIPFPILRLFIKTLKSGKEVRTSREFVVYISSWSASGDEKNVIKTIKDNIPQIAKEVAPRGHTVSWVSANTGKLNSIGCFFSTREEQLIDNQ
ncbi:MAG: hypothetical protein ACOX3T_02610 [Bdellovibrionota bacterium]